MTIHCTHPNCELCSHDKCELKEPCNEKITLLEKEISYEVKQLQDIRRSISNNLTSNDYYTPPYHVLKRLEQDTIEIIRELRKELNHEIQINRVRLYKLGRDS